jgi:hypothetical protein
VRVIVIAAALGMAVAMRLSAQECDASVLTGLRQPGELHLVATATPDTVRADWPTHGAIGTAPWPARGQVVRVERSIGGDQAGPAVLVPWAAGDRCSVVAWSSSARWLPPGTRGLFAAYLRPRAAWAHGLPTYDVYNAHGQPYPQVEAMEWADRRVPLLGIDALADFLAILPTTSADSADPEAARRPLWAWARAHPRLATHEPASFFLSTLCDELLAYRMRDARSPLAGTYRMRVELTGEPAREFFVRTTPHASEVVHPLRGDQRELYCAGRTPKEYGWLAIGGTAPDRLAGYGSGYQSSFIISSSGSGGAGATVTRAELDLALLARLFPEAPAYHAFSLAVTNRAARSTAEAQLAGQFVRAANGGVSFNQSVRLPDRTLTITGERVSALVVVRRP